MFFPILPFIMQNVALHADGADGATCKGGMLRGGMRSAAGRDSGSNRDSRRARPRWRWRDRFPREAATAFPREIRRAKWHPMAWECVRGRGPGRAPAAFFRQDPEPDPARSATSVMPNFFAVIHRQRSWKREQEALLRPALAERQLWLRCEHCRGFPTPSLATLLSAKHFMYSEMTCATVSALHALWSRRN